MLLELVSSIFMYPQESVTEEFLAFATAMFTMLGLDPLSSSRPRQVDERLVRLAIEDYPGPDNPPRHARRPTHPLSPTPCRCCR